MRLTIIGAESLGVRSMCCVVETGTRRVLIDPGVALATRRSGLGPHPVELAAADETRARILAELPGATDVVISHFHGDHAPLAEAGPSQVPLARFAERLGDARIWVKSRSNNTRLMDRRYADTENVLAGRLVDADGRDEGDIAFSWPMLHGREGRGSVLLTRVKDGGESVVHGSDIQLLDDEAVDLILAWRPDVVFVAGPPVYLDALGPAARERAWQNGLRLARGVGTLILDHHLLRSETGREWLGRLSDEAGRKVFSAAEFMDRPVRLLEAHRRELYDRARA